MKISEQDIINVLEQCFDPEIPIDLWNLGLIYKIDISVNANNKSDVYILMTLTTPGCMMGEQMANDIKNKINNLEEVGIVNVEVTFEPAWEPSMMSDYARNKLGFEDKTQQEDQDVWE